MGEKGYHNTSPVGVGWRRRCKPRLSQRQLDRQGAVSFFSRFYVSAVAKIVVELDHSVRSGEPELLARWVVTRSVHVVRHPRGSYIVSPLLPLDVATPENKVITLKLSSVCMKIRTRYRGLRHKRFSAERRSPFNATHRTPRGASRLVARDVCLVGENPTCSVAAV